MVQVNIGLGAREKVGGSASLTGATCGKPRTGPREQHKAKRCVLGPRTGAFRVGVIGLRAVLLRDARERICGEQPTRLGC